MPKHLERSCIFTLGLLGPGVACAHGEEILVTLYAQAAVVVIALIAMAFWPAPFGRKAIVFGALMLGVLTAWLATANIPYRDNSGMIIAVNTLLPIVGALIAFKLAVRSGRKKQ